MVNANELRIGNWLYTLTDPERDNKSIYAVQIMMGSNIDTIGYACNSVGLYTPIPLITEILEKCGFEMAGRFFEKEEIILLNTDNIYLYFYSSKSDKRIEIKYLHQLQNLCFALTGEELQIEL